MQDIPSVKARLVQAEQNLKTANETAVKNNERLRAELTASNARDRREIAACAAEVKRVEKVLKDTVHMIWILFI